MELHHLEAFSAVMSAGSVTGAGRLIGRSQPAVTRMIQELEQEIGYALFDRKGPRVTPTHRAFLLYEEVERSLVGLDSIRASARTIGLGGNPGGPPPTPALAAALVPRALALIAAPDARDQTDAHVDLQLRSVSAEHVIQALLARTVEVGIATLPLDHGTLDLHYIIEAPCVAVLHSKHALTQQEILSLEDIAAHPVVTVANRYRLRRRIDAAFHAEGLAPSVVFETNASLNAVMAAQSKLGVALVDPATAYGTHIADTVVRQIEVSIPFLYGVVTLPGRALSSEAVQLIESISRLSLDLLPNAVLHPATMHDVLMTRAAHSTQVTLKQSNDMTGVSA
jgi:DNA-binding transcriptional LysR family regulator